MESFSAINRRLLSSDTARRLTFYVDVTHGSRLVRPKLCFNIDWHFKLLVIKLLF